ncbi:MAG: tRNA epoxyqueuosine(34) reductase QueG [Oceanococcaceae bacterium]
MTDPADLQALSNALPAWGHALGFSGVAVSRMTLEEDHDLLARWVAEGRHAGMDWLARSLPLRRDANYVHPGTLSIISVKQPCWGVDTGSSRAVLAQPERGYIARYALGRDYHKSLRQKLKALAQKLVDAVPDMRYRVATDSAPLLEKALARDASLGWVGKHTLLMDRTDGSQFLLGEILTDLPLPPSQQPAQADGCGQCQACLTICPTQALTGPRQLDARRCLAFWTIEHKGTIPREWRKPMGNRIFGCDDCQLVCPWNRLAASTVAPDYLPRHNLDAPHLLDLWQWSREDYDTRLAGMPIRRAGWLGWRRNLCIALGNMPPSLAVIDALERAPAEDCDWWEELRAWALAEQRRDGAPPRS